MPSHVVVIPSAWQAAGCCTPEICGYLEQQGLNKSLQIPGEWTEFFQNSESMTAASLKGSFPLLIKELKDRRIAQSEVKVKFIGMPYPCREGVPEPGVDQPGGTLFIYLGLKVPAFLLLD